MAVLVRRPPILSIPKPSIFPIVANGRFLQTATGQPFMLIADSPMTMSTNISVADATAYVTTRAAQGFNGLQFDLVATPYVFNNNANYGTIGGVTPFTGALVTTPNPTYFALMDQLVNICANHGMLALLNPYETGNGLADLVTAGTSACSAYGNFLGNRYKNNANVMWFLGNDCLIDSQTKFNVMQALAQGILANDHNHLMTIELNFNFSTSFDNTGGFGSFAGTMSVNGAYTYGPTYGQCLLAYNNSSVSFAGSSGTNTTPPCPTILLEEEYEFENVGPISAGGIPSVLRKEAYWCTAAAIQISC